MKVGIIGLGYIAKKAYLPVLSEKRRYRDSALYKKYRIIDKPISMNFDETERIVKHIELNEDSTI